MGPFAVFSVWLEKEEEEEEEDGGKIVSSIARCGPGFSGEEEQQFCAAGGTPHFCWYSVAKCVGRNIFQFILEVSHMTHAVRENGRKTLF